MEAKFELGLGRWAAAWRGCEPSSDGAGPAENETEAGGWLGGSEAAGSFGAGGRDCWLVFNSQPRCSLRLLRVMKPTPNSRPRLGPRTSGFWNSSGFLGDQEKDRKLGTSALIEPACLVGEWGNVHEKSETRLAGNAPSGALVWGAAAAGLAATAGGSCLQERSARDLAGVSR